MHDIRLNDMLDAKEDRGLKFIFGEIPKNKGFDFTGFLKLTEPPKSVFKLIATSFQMCLWFVFLGIWLVIDHEFMHDLSDIGVADIGLVIFIVFFVHELIHASVYPLKRDGQVLFGCWPKMGVLYASYDGELSRNRWLAVYAMPFLLISVVPLVIQMYGVAPWIKIASVLNAGLSVGDLIAIYYITRQVPSNAGIVQDGWDTYWRVDS